jgi:pyroglutamyl-peptidase
MKHKVDTSYNNRCLLTSFQTWLPHQKSNSSDDLLEALTAKEIPNLSLAFLRRLPVDIFLASQQVIDEIDRNLFKTIVCCGMAESREKLTIESNAIHLEEQIHSKVDLDVLVKDLTFTTVSHDAGKFVCEGLYFHVLDRIRKKQLSSSCIFVHVPIITAQNRQIIIADFLQIIQKLDRGCQTNK